MYAVADAVLRMAFFARRNKVTRAALMEALKGIQEHQQTVRKGSRRMLSTLRREVDEKNVVDGDSCSYIILAKPTKAPCSKRPQAQTTRQWSTSKKRREL